MKAFNLVVAAAGGLVISLSHYSLCFAANWLELTTSRGGSVYFVDAQSFSRQGSRIKFWTKVDASRDHSVLYRESKVLTEIDCDARAARTLSITLYDPDGAIIGSNNSQFAPFEPIIPDSIGDAMSELCSVGLAAD